MQTRLFSVATFVSLLSLVRGEIVCLRGSYFDGSNCVLCPGGTFGSLPGLTTAQCSGPCSPGHFCPPGSTSPIARPCGATTYYCPSGSAMRQRVDEGFYTATFPLANPYSPTSITSAEKQTQCEPGYYCANGIRRKCPAGSYGSTPGLLTSVCSGLCPKGFYCPEGTGDPLPCPPGTFGADLGLQTAACSGLCPIGHYCLAGTITPRSCPAGSFGGSQGLTTKHCSSNCPDGSCVPSPCPAGFYCPLATTTPIPCGDVGLYCPQGSATPTSASIGFYTIWRLANTPDEYTDGGSLASINQTTRRDQRQCEPGTYCVSGVKRQCPAGTYGNSNGLASAQCSGLCPPGFFCPIGTVSYYRFPCVERTSFCRQGSQIPSPVSIGYFTVTSPTGDTRVDQTVCPMGSYCLGGIKYLCPAGTYGATTGLATRDCSGRCQGGYTCAAGSTSATQSPCPAGQYSRNGVACAPCLPGYWCSAGSNDPKQNECGSDSVFCPLGSSGPINVAAGSFAVGQTPTTHSSQAVCLVQTVQHLPQCPSRTIGANSGL